MDVQLHFPMSGFPIRGASSKGFWFPPEMILAGSLEMHYIPHLCKWQFTSNNI